MKNVTNKEKAQEIGEKCATIAMEMCSCEYECTQSALLMAQWKDEQYTKEKEALINKACEWLKDNYPYYFETDIEERFVKAMKGGNSENN